MLTVGNASSPLVIPLGDGRRLAYSFLEYTDADLFRRRLTEQQQTEGVSLQVVSLSLADVIKAYKMPAAVEASEMFAIVPTMQSVVTARRLMRLRGATAESLTSGMSAANGLVPLFYIKEMVTQSASGKHRKVLFFRETDAIMMWQNISAARKEAGDPDVPAQPELLVADLQTVVHHLMESNMTDDCVFAPSTAALRAAAQGRLGVNEPAPTSKQTLPAGIGFQGERIRSAAVAESPEEDYDLSMSSVLEDEEEDDDEDN